MIAKFALVILACCIVVSQSYEFAGHEWGCSFDKWCNSSDVYRCDGRECIDYICMMLSDTTEWTMIQPWPEMKQSCTWKNYGHEPCSNMTMVGVALNEAIITDKFTCHTIDGCLETLCNLSLMPLTYRIYAIADRKKCSSLG